MDEVTVRLDKRREDWRTGARDPVDGPRAVDYRSGRASV